MAEPSPRVDAAAPSYDFAPWAWAVAVATLVSLTAATAPSARPRPEDRPVGTTLRPRRAGYALAMAPVGAAGVVGHVMLGFLA